MFRISGSIKFEILVEDSNTGRPSLFTVRMEYLFAFPFWYCKLCVENRWGADGGMGMGEESIVLLIFVIWRCFSRRWMRGCGVGHKVLFRAGWNPRRDLSQRNKHDSFWHVVSTGHFYVLFLWAIFVSDFLPLEIYKNLVIPLPSITFAANSQADNHFYKNISLFQICIIQYEISFFMKIHVKDFHIHI